jgi:hypothetical protein
MAMIEFPAFEIGARARPGKQNGAGGDHVVMSSPSCPGLSRASTFLGTVGKKDVNGRVKPGHDEE